MRVERGTLVASWSTSTYCTFLSASISRLALFSLLIRAHSLSITSSASSANQITIDMFNRKYRPRTFILAPVPLFRRLRLDQRKRLEKSSKKVGKVLGEEPIVDIVTGDLQLLDASPINTKESRGKRVGKPRKAPPAPVLRYRLPAIVTTVEQVESEGELDEQLEDVPPPVPRKHAPASLNLPTPVWRARGHPLSIVDSIQPRCVHPVFY